MFNLTFPFASKGETTKTSYYFHGSDEIQGLGSIFVKSKNDHVFLILLGTLDVKIDKKGFKLASNQLASKLWFFSLMNPRNFSCLSTEFDQFYAKSS